jgi:hypothetical protein
MEGFGFSLLLDSLHMRCACRFQIQRAIHERGNIADSTGLTHYIKALPVSLCGPEICLVQSLLSYRPGPAAHWVPPFVLKQIGPDWKKG